MRLLVILLVARLVAAGQEVKIEYDKKFDLSKYRTFSFGESTIAASNDLKSVNDSTFDKWIKHGVTRELEFKGVHKVDSLADLTVTYLFVRTPQLDIEVNGPLGVTPGSSERTWSRNYTESTLVVDLNDHSNRLVWRVRGTFDVMGRGAESTIDMIIARGFKKYGKGKKQGGGSKK